jgi:hypothetical protein
MSRALLALVIGLAVGNPLVQYLAGVGGSRKAGSQWDPNGANTAGEPTTEAGGTHDPDGSTAEAGNHWDPNG